MASSHSPVLADVRADRALRVRQRVLDFELDGHRLRIRGEDPVINPALTLRLRKLGIELPVAGSLADLVRMAERLQIPITHSRRGEDKA